MLKHDYRKATDQQLMVINRAEAFATRLEREFAKQEWSRRHNKPRRVVQHWLIKEAYR